jgi:hypothetical protein
MIEHRLEEFAYASDVYMYLYSYRRQVVYRRMEVAKVENNTKYM